MSDMLITSDSALEQAGIEEISHKADGLELIELSSVTLLRIHSLQARSELNTTLADSNIQLPEHINQSSGQDPSVLCLAPGEWLLFSEYLGSDLLHEKLQPAVQPQLTSLCDQTSAYAVFRLLGGTAAWLLSKCCGLDFHQGIQQGQHCTRTRLDQAPALLHYHQPGSGSGPFVFDVLVERSLARYTWQLFLDYLPHAHELEQQHGPYYTE